MPGCTNTQEQHVKEINQSHNDPRCLRIKATFSCEVIHASIPRELGGNPGHVVVYFARAAHAFSAGIKCLHCIYVCNLLTIFVTYERYIISKYINIQRKEQKLTTKLNYIGNKYKFSAPFTQINRYASSFPGT